MTEIRPEKTDPVILTAFVLGLAGLIPFLVSAFLTFASEGAFLGLDVRLIGLFYGAVILSFLGGIRWGLAIAPLTRVDRAKDISISVLPSLLGFFALLLPLTAGLGLLFAGFALQYLWDFQSHRKGHLPGWFHLLRLILSLGAGASILLLLTQPVLMALLG